MNSDQFRSKRLNAYLDSAGSGGRSQSVPALDPVADSEAPLAERPSIRYTEPISTPPSEPVKLPPPDPELRGTLVGLICSAKPPSITVESEGRNHSFLLDHPDRIVVVGSPSGTIDLNCGPQRPRSVRVVYDLAGATPATTGSLKLLEFVTDTPAER